MHEAVEKPEISKTDKLLDSYRKAISSFDNQINQVEAAIREKQAAFEKEINSLNAILRDLAAKKIAAKGAIDALEESKKE